MHDMATIFEWYLSHLNYWVLTILMILENSLVPLPAELIVTPVAYSATHGGMSITMVVLCATLGSTIGALINYSLSRYLGRFLIYRFVDGRWGQLLMMNREKLEKVEQLFLRHGNVSTLFGRLLPFGRQFISIPAGLARMPVGPFLLYTTIGSAIWNSLLVGAGCYLARIVTKEELSETMSLYSIEISIGFVILLLIYIIYGFLRKKYKQI